MAGIPNSEILFIYDCKECNPNGDPDNENRPRKDLLKERVLVSDVRLKRYIRDYFLNQKNTPIFVSKVEDKTVDATDRFAYFLAEILSKDLKNYEDKLKNIKKDLKKDEPSIDEIATSIKNKKLWGIVNIEDFLNYFIDIRLFGITLPIKDETRGTSITFTGPVQFLWGYSLNKAEEIESPSITSYFAGRTKGEGEEGGAIGKDWRVYYAIISFYGRISGNSAKKTNLFVNDINELDDAIWKSIITETNTRTKLGQQPRFYLRVEFSDNETFVGDLRRYIDIDKKEGLRDIGEYNLRIDSLVEKLKVFKDKIGKLILKKDSDTNINGYEKLKSEFKEKVEEL